MDCVGSSHALARTGWSQCARRWLR